jgi:hypothetical protein
MAKSMDKKPKEEKKAAKMGLKEKRKMKKAKKDGKDCY